MRIYIYIYTVHILHTLLDCRWTNLFTYWVGQTAVNTLDIYHVSKFSGICPSMDDSKNRGKTPQKWMVYSGTPY